MRELYVPIVATVLMMVIAGYVVQVVGRVTDQINATNARITAHLTDCDKISKERLDERVDAAEREIVRSRAFMHWVANCLMIMATKMDVRIPGRPE